MPAEMNNNRQWGSGNSPKTAVKEFIAKNSDFTIGKSIHEKLLITAAPDGYLIRDN
jgi:cephalosporin hydroxylase